MTKKLQSLGMHYLACSRVLGRIDRQMHGISSAGRLRYPITTIAFAERRVVSQGSSVSRFLDRSGF